MMAGFPEWWGARWQCAPSRSHFIDPDLLKWWFASRWLAVEPDGLAPSETEGRRGCGMPSLGNRPAQHLLWRSEERTLIAATTSIVP
jgi:hypothetical protein